ncbi:unnamed protein product [Lampetra fluviatilis]
MALGKSVQVGFVALSGPPAMRFVFDRSSGFQSGHVKSTQDLAQQRRGVLRDATLSVDLCREAEDVLLAASKGEAEGEDTPLAGLPANVGHEHDPCELLSPTGEQEMCSLACFQRHPQTAKNQP